MNLTQEIVNEKLIELGGNMLKPHYKKQWTADNPTFGYCYIVSEAIYHYGDSEYEPYCINYGEGIGTHWFLIDKHSGEIIDFTQDQFPFKVDHSIGRRQAFLKGGTKTSRGWISKRGKQMAIHLGLIEGGSE